MECDIGIAATRNVHKWKEDSIRKLSKQWDRTPDHFNKLDLRGFLQDKEITQVEMEDAEPDAEPISDSDNSISGSTGNAEKRKRITGKSEEEDEVRFLTKRKSEFAVIID